MATECRCGCGCAVSTGATWLRGHNTSPLGIGHEYEIDEDTGCWVWQKSTNGRGYGRARFAGQPKIAYAHRVYYERAHGPIPDGMTIDHLCHNRRCVNAAHMRLLTRSEHGALHSAEVVHPPRQRFYCADCGVEITRNGTRCHSCLLYTSDAA